MQNRYTGSYGLGGKTTLGGSKASNYDMSGPPSDTVTCLRFSPAGTTDYLAAGSWDSTIRLWKFTATAATTAAAQKEQEGYSEPYSKKPKIDEVACYADANGAILRCDFNGTGDVLYYGTVNGTIGALDLKKIGASTSTTTKSPYSTMSTGMTAGQSQIKIPVVGKTQIGLITGLRWCESQNCLVVATTITDENGEQTGNIVLLNPAGTKPEDIFLKAIPLEKGLRPFDLDIVGTTCIVAAGGICRNISTFDITKVATVSTAAVVRESQFNDFSWNFPIQAQLTSICAIQQHNPANICFICGSILGFVEVLYEQTNNGTNYNLVKSILPLHRTEATNNFALYSSNCVSAKRLGEYPNEKAVAISCGSNGNVTYLNLSTLHQVEKQGPKPNVPITACALSPYGEVAAIAQGYDWSKGAEHLSKQTNQQTISVSIQIVPSETFT